MVASLEPHDEVGAIDETASVQAAGGLYDFILITTPWHPPYEGEFMRER